MEINTNFSLTFVDVIFLREKTIPGQFLTIFQHIFAVIIAKEYLFADG